MANTYTKEDKKTIKALKDAGVELTGEETSEELNTLKSAQSIKADDEENPEDAVRKEIPGVPDKLPVVTEDLIVAGKPAKYAVHFVAAVKGGFALYNEFGVRISAVASEIKDVQYINKAAARNNATRRANRLPQDK